MIYTIVDTLLSFGLPILMIPFALLIRVVPVGRFYWIPILIWSGWQVMASYIIDRFSDELGIRGETLWIKVAICSGIIVWAIFSALKKES
jgi:hypothetical protein